jgi:hypothetical protein|tara:strand:+ start:1677 stop:1823 length:147 start_codon:yes stop_codon:yes gene_type:complete
MGCNCKNKKKKISEENTNPTIRRQKQEEILRLKESLRKQLSNFKRLSK